MNLAPTHTATFLDDPPSGPMVAARRHERPPAWEEALSFRLFHALSPRLARAVQDPTPRFLGPAQPFAVRRRDGGGDLAAIWFPSDGAAQAATLLLHPWSPWGKSYFYRRGRIAALRRAGHHVMIADLPGFGASGPPRGFYDTVIENLLDVMAVRARGLRHCVWGVSAGGYWAHPAIARRGGVDGAVFEDVAPHFLEWSTRTQPLGIPFYRGFRLLFRRTYRFLDLRGHAPRLGVSRLLYVGGGSDRGIPVADQEQLAQRAGGRSLVVPEAGHLEAIKRAQRKVLAAAIETLG